MGVQLNWRSGVYTLAQVDLFDTTSGCCGTNRSTYYRNGTVVLQAGTISTHSFDFDDADFTVDNGASELAAPSARLHDVRRRGDEVPDARAVVRAGRSPAPSAGIEPTQTNTPFPPSTSESPVPGMGDVGAYAGRWREADARDGGLGLLAIEPNGVFTWGADQGTLQPTDEGMVLQSMTLEPATLVLNHDVIEVYLGIAGHDPSSGVPDFTLRRVT